MLIQKAKGGIVFDIACTINKPKAHEQAYKKAQYSIILVIACTINIPQACEDAYKKAQYGIILDKAQAQACEDGYKIAQYLRQSFYYYSSGSVHYHTDSMLCLSQFMNNCSI